MQKGRKRRKEKVQSDEDQRRWYDWSFGTGLSGKRGRREVKQTDAGNAYKQIALISELLKRRDASHIKLSQVR
jgi:curved DNA-binding protein CbpA